MNNPKQTPRSGSRTTGSPEKPGAADAGSLPPVVGAQESLKLLERYQAQKLQLETLVDELRRSNEELELKRNKYALLYDVAPVGFLTLNPDGIVLSVNQTGVTLIGLPRVEIVNRRFGIFVTADDRPTYDAFLKKVFRTKVKETCRLQLSKYENRQLFVRIEATATASGSECHLALLDITERRLADEALRESEYNLSKAQSMSHVGSWRSDPATGALAVSDELLRILQLSREDATQEAFISVIHPEDMEPVLAKLRQGIEHGVNYEIEHRLKLRNGTIKWVFTIVEPLVNSAGHIVSLYGTTQDITDRKEVEVALRNQKNELQAIFNSVNDGVIVFDSQGMVQHFNQVSQQYFPQQELASASCRQFFHEEHLSQKDCPVEQALAGQRVESSLVQRRENKDNRYLDVTATPIEDALGEKNRALLFFRDKTEKRLQELQLIQAEKMSSLGILATGVAHEINNPLTSVAGYAEALLRRFREDPALVENSTLGTFPKYLEVIVRESYHCKGIIDNLLNFSRKSDGFACEVDLNGILSEILELLLHQPGHGQVEIVTVLARGALVLGDPSGLRQVFMNLLYNAFQSIKEGGQVEVTTRYAENGTVVETQIRDTGCGIAPEVLGRIWDPFFTTKEVGKGVGLGLALTYNIVKRHGGTITVETKINEGSTFTVRLPVAGAGRTV